MLTRKQIQKLALKNRVPLFTQERDYIQAASFDHIFAEKVRALIVRGWQGISTTYGSCWKEASSLILS